MEYLFVDVNNNFAQVPGADTFNEDISGWDVSNVTSMEGMFTGARKFNHNLDKWADKTGKVTNMRYMCWCLNLIMEQHLVQMEVLH